MAVDLRLELVKELVRLHVGVDRRLHVVESLLVIAAALLGHREAHHLIAFAFGELGLLLLFLAQGARGFENVFEAALPTASTQERLHIDMTSDAVFFLRWAIFSLS